MHPIVLAANQPADRFYRGGERIAAFRAGGADLAVVARPTTGLAIPEDWIGSLTTVFGESELGLTRLPSGELLRDAVEADPVAWLGLAHAAVRGCDPALLVKLLDAGQRLPVHAHPDVAFAEGMLGLAHGKTEAWIALAPATVHLAFARDVTAEQLARWVADQDTAAMLGAMHTLPMAAGDAVLVPAGLPHAIGEGALVVELQEPTDLSILLEWSGFAIDGAALGHLGLGFDVALAAVDRRGWSEDEVAALVRSRAGTVGPLLPGAEAFFRADRLHGGDGWEAGLAVAVVVAGHGEIVTDGAVTAVRSGETALVPHAAGDVALRGDLTVLLARPPAP
ncbi:carbohydrate kinase [Serinibacter arcticus]|uniref:Carbohydrate kinase n=1 Tax=Serinibacter arcticus TaxID=1655435 RepID=A0A2U1ZSZ6_9MICO|nr:class I mannose-6-phosphate isomerase [Serinibacter arcticus]PWD50108.1 carbohydrate kinase [Serinibacter arcticus]